MTLKIEKQEIPLEVDSNGVVHVAGTRVTLDSVVAVFEQGATAEQIVQEFDTLKLADVYAVIVYYLRHGSEVESYLQRRTHERETVRRECEARFGDTKGVRERLLKRRSPQGT